MPEGVKQNKNGTEMEHYNRKQPQSSSAFNTVRQGNHGLGYSLLAIVHRMKGDSMGKTMVLITISSLLLAGAAFAVDFEFWVWTKCVTT